MRLAIWFVVFFGFVYGCTVAEDKEPIGGDAATDNSEFPSDNADTMDHDIESDEQNELGSDTGLGSDGSTDSDMTQDSASDENSDGDEGSDDDTDLGDPGEGRIVAYYTSWSIYARSFQVADIPAEKVTHINYAFANISAGGEVVMGDPWADVEKAYQDDTWDQDLKGNFNQLIQLKKENPHLKTLISVGGWTWSGRFSDVALTKESREKFAASAVRFIMQYGFDGVDIDWEYPVGGGLSSNTARSEDKQNFTLLMKELREQLDARGQVDGVKYLLSAATAAGKEKIANLEVSNLVKYADWINIMTYDFHGAWESTTNHHAPLFRSSGDPTLLSGYNADSAVTQYLKQGAPSHKLCLGIPIYGHAWKGVPSANNGLFQSATGVPPGTWDDGVSGATGVNDFWQIKEFERSKGYIRLFDEEAKVPYLYSELEHGGHMISYEDQESLKHKLNYVASKKLGGMMLWELSGDVKDNPNESLLEQIYDFYN